jgi:hypothetical protein
MIPYVTRPTIDGAIAQLIESGSGAYALVGPPGAGKSAALLHGLSAEARRRGRRGGGHVRLVQLWGDEPPSLFARRLVREATHLHLASYPRPEDLRVLIEAMCEAVPGLSPAGKLLGTLVPDDLRPLHEVALQALRDVGDKAVQAGGPLVLGVDLMGGTPGPGMREFFERLAALLPPTVVLLVAQPEGEGLLQVPPAHRVAVGPLALEEARTYLRHLLGAVDAEAEALLQSGALSLLPGDLALLGRQALLLGRGGLRAAAEALHKDVAARYQVFFEAAAARPDEEARAAVDLCAWVALAARPDQPVTAEDALRRVASGGGGGSVRGPADLYRLRRAEVVEALCVTPTPLAAAAAAAAAADWPLLPRHVQAREGVLRWLSGRGLLDLYRRRYRDELLATMREAPGPRGLMAGVRALLLIMEEGEEAEGGPGDRDRERERGALGQAVGLLGEMEVLLWRAGWHRTFADLYDALCARLSRAGVSALDAAPTLWFRRARARVQGVDWSGSGLTDELPRAIADLTALTGLSEVAVLQAQVGLGLMPDGRQVAQVCRYLPMKARQGRGYARVLSLLRDRGGAAQGSEHDDATRQQALDDILMALAYFSSPGPGPGPGAGAAGDPENLAQTLTILADWYSAAGEAGDDAALFHYHRAVAVAEAATPPPAFCLGVVHRSMGLHHLRRGRAAEGDAALAEAKRYLLSSRDAAMGTLLAGLLRQG